MINSLYIFLYRSTRTVAVAVEEGENYFTVVKFIDMEDTDQEIVQIFHLQIFFYRHEFTKVNKLISPDIL